MSKKACENLKYKSIDSWSNHFFPKHMLDQNSPDKTDASENQGAILADQAIDKIISGKSRSLKNKGN